MINTVFRTLHQKSSLYLYRTVVKNARKSSVVVDAGEFCSWRSSYMNNSVSTIVLRFGKCVFQGNVINLKNNCGVLVEHFPPDKLLSSSQDYLVIHSIWKLMLSHLLASQEGKGLTALISGNVFDAKHDKSSRKPGVFDPIKIMDVLKTVRIKTLEDQLKFLSSQTCLSSLDTLSISCYNNLFSKDDSFFQEPYGESLASVISQMKEQLRNLK